MIDQNISQFIHIYVLDLEFIFAQFWSELNRKKIKSFQAQNWQRVRPLHSGALDDMIIMALQEKSSRAFALQQSSLQSSFLESVMDKVTMLYNQNQRAIPFVRDVDQLLGHLLQSTKSWLTSIKNGKVQCVEFSIRFDFQFCPIMKLVGKVY